MEAPTAQPQGISHTCFGDNVIKYSEPVPAWMVWTRDQLLAKFGQKQPVKQVIQENTLKTP